MRHREMRASAREARLRLQHHHGRERISRAWTLGRLYPDGTMEGNESYTVTWTPGVLSLSGDLGDLTVTHYGAMGSLEGAVSWIGRNSDLGYLLSKSDAKEQYDPEHTLSYLREWASGDARPALVALRDQRREYRRAVAEGQEEWRADHRAWRLGTPGIGESPEEEPQPADYGPHDGDRPEALTIKRLGCFLRHDDLRLESSIRLGGFHYTVPAGWELWARMWDESGSDDDVGVIFTSAGRRQVLRLLAEYLTTAEDAGDLCARLHLDDYHGNYSYTERHILKIMCLKRWAEHVSAELARQPAECAA